MSLGFQSRGFCGWLIAQTRENKIYLKGCVCVFVVGVALQGAFPCPSAWCYVVVKKKKKSTKQSRFLICFSGFSSLKEAGKWQLCCEGVGTEGRWQNKGLNLFCVVRGYTVSRTIPHLCGECDLWKESFRSSPSVYTRNRASPSSKAFISQEKYPKIVDICGKKIVGI